MIFPGLAAYADWGLFALRLVVGIIFVVHGWPKLTNARGMASAFGQAGTGMIVFLTALGAVETLGGIAMILGIWVQIAAIVLALVMVGAIGAKNTMMKTGFTAQQATGWEFDLTLLAANLVLLTTGPGRIAVLA
jgi:putative oxidoreductase